MPETWKHSSRFGRTVNPTVAPDDAQDALRDLRHVGPATVDVLSAADVTREDVMSKRVSHAQLVEYGVNPGVAARIRREHSLQWSFEGGEDLDRRAEQVRGLKDDERQWVAASYGEDDDDAEADGSGDAAAAEADWQATATAGAEEPTAVDEPDHLDGTGGGADGEDEEVAWREGSWPNRADDESVEREEEGEAAWREASAPTPVTVLADVDEAAAAMLARAGITSVRSLATARVDQVADSLGASCDRVRALRDAAREHVQ